MRSLDVLIAVTAEGPRPLVVGEDEHEVRLPFRRRCRGRCVRRRCNRMPEQKSREHEANASKDAAGLTPGSKSGVHWVLNKCSHPVGRGDVFLESWRQCLRACRCFPRLIGRQRRPLPPAESRTGVAAVAAYILFPPPMTHEFRPATRPTMYFIGV